MKRIILAALLTAVAVSGTGCSTSDHVAMMIRPRLNRLPDWADPTESYLEHKRIDLHRRIAMPDGAEIDLWVIKARSKDGKDYVASKGTIVLLHGINEEKTRYIGIVDRVARKGYDVVVPDLRYHGKSTGECITYGAKEKHDIKAVMDELIRTRQVSPKIIVYGFTLGGAVAIQYAAIDERVQGVMALAPYKDMRSITQRLFLLITEEDFEKTLAQAAAEGDFNPEEASAVEAASKIKVPMLLVHGLLDLSVPLEHSKAIRDAAAGPKKLLIVTPGPEQWTLAAIWEDCCLLYTSPSPRDLSTSRMPSSA